MKEMKRILSLVLCFAMFVGMLPMFALRAGATEEGLNIQPITGTGKIEVTENVSAQAEGTAAANYPEYPDEGAVKVSKTGTGVNFQSSGIAQVEISASGVPMKRGIDIIVMLDMSSSMDKCISCGKDTGIYSSKTDRCNCSNPVTRVDELRDAMTSLKNVLVAAPGADDIKIAVADFNGYYTSNNSPYQIDTKDRTQDKSGLTNAANTRVLTGTHALNAGAFVKPSALDIESYFSTRNGDIAHSGTNYDYAFDAIYQLGYAIQTANGQNQRDLYVLFMSDGAANQFNYYHTTGGDSGSSDWNYWLTGKIGNGAGMQTMKDTVAETHTYYYDAATGNQHRMANAVKGAKDQTYEIIRKNQGKAAASDAVTEILIPLDRSDANYGKENMYKLPGLGAQMYSVAFFVTNDGPITEASAKHALKQIPSSPEMYIEAENEGSLASAFANIGTDILYAAYNARFVDQMGEYYDLKLGKLEALNDKGQLEELKVNGATVTNKIEVISYDIYQAGDTIPNGKQVGDRKGTSTVLETVTFNDAGTAAYSDQIGAGTNILGADGIIRAKSFYYNTTSSGVAVEGISIPQDKTSSNLTANPNNVLPAESFYWDMGTITTKELALRYYVYLTESLEGGREAGSYPTNTYATLYYDNYLNNPCYKDTVSPVLPWKEANVSYAFYLVDTQGRPVVNQTSGQTGTFANKIAVTNPVVYSTVLLNSNETVDANVVAATVLPEGYTLYSASSYTVQVNSNATGSWNIEGGQGTTYVMQYDLSDPSAYSNATSVNGTGNDYTHTVVWFAVVWSIQALPDTVVIDYGLPVEISVLANDMFGANGKLSRVGAIPENLNLEHRTDGDQLSGTYTSQRGSAVADPSTGKVRYTPTSMEWNGYDRFAYSVNYTGNPGAGYYYDTVTVIPATTIYFEDSFLNFAAEGGAQWQDEGTAVTNPTQAEDRPGQYSMTDANNIYGYDAVNKSMSQFSLGTAKKVRVTAESSATATFSFYGTGFDIIGMTSNTTGVLAVKVTAAEEIKNADGSVAYAAGATAKATVVNTYYGYNYENGQWVPAPDTANAMYQVPVLQTENLPYGKYNVVLTATYMEVMDKTGDKDGAGYDLYIDAVRIYDPANDGAGNQVIEDAYKADHEGWPSYIELRNGLIAAETFGNADTNNVINGLVFIDGIADVGNSQIADYISYGPNNEVYLDGEQSIAFLLNTPANIDRVHIGAKSANGQAVSYKIYNIAKEANADLKLSKGQKYNEKTFTVDTSTDMYYDLTAWKNNIIVIENTGSGIISLTNIKSTYTSNPAGVVSSVPSAPSQGSDATVAAVETASEPVLTSVYMTRNAAELVLASMNAPEVFEPETFEVTVNKQDVKVGEKVKVKITTATDVSRVTVNGKKVTKSKYDKKKGVLIWEIDLKAEKAGTMEISVVAYDHEGLASEAEELALTVAAKGGKKEGPGKEKK